MALLAIVLMAILVVCVATFLRSVMGKPVRGVLHVPQGNNHVDVTAFDCRCLKPYKCGQVFDAEVVPTEHAMTSIYTGEERSGRGAISFKGTPIGFADWNSSYSQVLWTLTSMYTRVVVKAVILGIDADGHPVMRLNLPDPMWFSRAARNGNDVLDGAGRADMPRA